MRSEKPGAVGCVRYEHICRVPRGESEFRLGQRGGSTGPDWAALTAEAKLFLQEFYGEGQLDGGCMQMMTSKLVTPQRQEQ